MSRFFHNYVQDPRSQNPGFQELWMRVVIVVIVFMLLLFTLYREASHKMLYASHNRIRYRYRYSEYLYWRKRKLIIVTNRNLVYYCCFHVGRLLSCFEPETFRLLIGDFTGWVKRTQWGFNHIAFQSQWPIRSDMKQTQENQIRSKINLAWFQLQS